MLPTFEVFGLSIPMFGVMMMLGMLAAFVLLAYTRRFVRFTEDEIFSCAIWAIVLGFLGSKVLYWFTEWKAVLADPRFLIDTLRTGFVFYGALLGGLLGVLLYCRKKKLPFFAFFDLLAPSIVLAQAFGRIGCFCAGCCYGAESHAACAVTFPVGSAAPAGIPRLPTQLFESAFLFLLTVVLVMILKKKKPFGVVGGWYMVLYGVWRFIIEFFRGDEERGFVGPLSTSQFIGIFIVLAGVALLVLVKKGVLHLSEIPRPALAVEAEEAEETEKEDGEAEETKEAESDEKENGEAKETNGDED